MDLPAQNAAAAPILPGPGASRRGRPSRPVRMVMSGGVPPPELLDNFLRALADVLAADMLAEAEAGKEAPAIRLEPAGGKPSRDFPGRMTTDFSGITVDVIRKDGRLNA